MEHQFVHARFNLCCDYQGIAPVYRILINGELFAEREWRWGDSTLRENLQLQAPAGVYELEIQQVTPAVAQFTVTDHDIVSGPGVWIDQRTISIAAK